MCGLSAAGKTGRKERELKMLFSRTAVLFMCLSVCLLSTPLFAAEDETANTEFSRLKTTFETELQKIIDSDPPSTVAEQGKYLAAAKALQNKVQQAGDLEALLAIRKETDRFSAARKITQDDISKDIPELASLQNAYIKAVEKYKTEKAQKILDLVQNYEKALDGLQESMTKKEDIRGAIEAKKEKERMTNRAEIMNARALIIETETKEAQEKKAEDAAVKAPVPQVPAEKAVVEQKAPVKRKYTVSPEKRIRQRFDDLAKSILNQDFSEASGFVDPEFTRKPAKDGVRRALIEVFPFLKLPNDSHRKLCIDSVKLDDKALTATVTSKLWAGYQWNNLPANIWIETEGDWYLDVSKVEEMEAADLKRINRAEQRKPWSKGAIKIMPGKK